MKKYVARFKKEDGAVAVIMAVIMVVLLGFTSFAVDRGIYYHKKSQLQAALDAAALAAVYKLPDQAEASATVLEYVQKNGFTANDVEIIFPADPKLITVKSARQQKTYFANILGFKYMDYKCMVTASASVIPAGGAFDYLLFSGSPSSVLEIKTNFNIYGSIHSNQNIYSSFNNGYVMGAAEAVGTVNFSNKIVVGQRISNAPFVPMVDFGPVIEQVVPPNLTYNASYGYGWLGSLTLWQLQEMANNGCVTINGNVRVKGNISFPKGLIVNGKLIVEGNVNVAGNVPGAASNTCLVMNQGSVLYAKTGYVSVDKHFSGTGCIFANGSISFVNGQVYVADKSTISLYSANGNITLNFGGTHGYGIIYAPNGNVTVGGGNTTWHGSIIGNTISAIPANITMYSNEFALPFIISSRSAILVE